MKDHYDTFRQLGCEVMGVSFSDPAIIAMFLAESPTPFPVLSDPSKAAYLSLGLGRTSWGGMFRFGVVARFLKLIFRGWMPRKSRKGEDLMQLGGDVLLDRQRRLIYLHRSAEPTDRPSLAELLRVVREASQAQ